MDVRCFEGNPWQDDEERRYGTSRRLMSLANDLGYKFDTPENSVQQQKALESYDSVKQLNWMSDISASTDKLNSTNRHISQILMDKETHDITSLSVIESRLNKLAALSSHLGEVVDNKSMITSRLQQPYSGENLLIDASLQKYVVEFFTMISPLLSDLSNLLDTITWTSTNAKHLPSKTDEVLEKLNSSLSSVLRQYERLQKLRRTVALFTNGDE